MNTKPEIVEITGNTYPVRAELKALGARWNGTKRCWMVHPDNAQAARALVGAPVPTVEQMAAATAGPVNWSDEQKAIFAWFETGTGNMVVQARAGTGKTTTIKQAFSHAPETGRLLYAVFNKKNQKEAQAKITDARVEVKTLHALGFYFIKNVWSGAKPEDAVEFDRVNRVEPGLPDEVMTQVIRLVGFCKNLTTAVPELTAVIEIADARNITVPDEFEAAYPLAKLAAIAIATLNESLVRDPLDRVSFNDMVWLPVAAGWVKPCFSMVVVDEAQDMNMPQLLMAERASKGRICIVGDDRQAIYGFRGAAVDGMHLMRQRLNAAQLGLTTTYRCPRCVVQLAQEIVPDYTAAPEAPQGEILDMSMSQAVRGLIVGDAVLSRLNAPLMTVCLALLRAGTSARIEGRDIGKQLVGMVRKLRAKSVPDFFKKLNNWEKKQIVRITASGGRHAASKIEMVQDQALTLGSVADGCNSVAEIETKITSLFEDSDTASKPAVVCSTVHKAKGLEWNRVCLIEDTFKNKDSEGEEANIYYVAVTRTKKTLVRAR